MTSFSALLLVIAVVWAVTRLKRGPRLSREDWSLYRDPATVTVPVRVDELVEPLRRYGYKPVIVPVGDGTAHFARLQQAGVRHGGIVVDLRDLPTKGYATLEAHDTGTELYSEMVKYALFELGKLMPGSTYREAYSPLTAELTETLEPQLPDQPHYLPR